MAKISQAELEELRQAKNLLDKLNTAVTADASATAYANAITDPATALQGLDGKGDDIARFIRARNDKIKLALSEATGGVSTALGLLTQTISNIEANEKRQTDAANATPAGKSGANSAPQQGRG